MSSSSPPRGPAPEPGRRTFVVYELEEVTAFRWVEWWVEASSPEEALTAAGARVGGRSAPEAPCTPTGRRGLAAFERAASIAARVEQRREGHAAARRDFELRRMVPAPPPRRDRDAPRVPWQRFGWRELRVGDHKVFPVADGCSVQKLRRAISSSLGRYARRNPGWRYQFATEHDDRSAPPGQRGSRVVVWRLADAVEVRRARVPE